MFGIFKKKCPICKMELEKGRAYPEGFGEKFCSESCKKKYEEQSKKSDDGCCH